MGKLYFIANQIWKTMEASRFILVLLIFFNLNLLFGQEVGNGNNGNRIKEDFKFLPIPYVNYNRTLGFQIGALPMAQFNLSSMDTISPSSMAGLFGMYTTNKSYFFMAFSKLYFDKDNWRFSLGGGKGSINFQFYLDFPFEIWVPYNTKMSMLFLQPSRRVYDKIYIGVSYVYIKFENSVEAIDGSKFTSLNGLGLNISADYRSNVYYPRKGFLTNTKLFSYPRFMGNNSESNKIEISFNQFIPMRKAQDVIALRGMIGIGLGDLDFNQQFVVGRGDDIRGYTQGEYRGNNMFAIQGEYRYNLAESKLGFVGFAGLASVSKSINQEQNGKLLPGAGVGFRYTVSKETNMNVGLDFAKGNGDWGIYFRVGETFSR